MRSLREIRANGCPCPVGCPLISEVPLGPPRGVLVTPAVGHTQWAFVTHNLAQARRLADWAALFWKEDDAGRLVEHGAVQRIFESPREELTAAYVRGRRS
jgi:hypothetical protein